MLSSMGTKFTFYIRITIRSFRKLIKYWEVSISTNNISLVGTLSYVFVYVMCGTDGALTQESSMC